MNVSVDDKMNAHTRSFRGTQIRFDLADGIDDGTGRATAAAEQVGDADGLTVQELTYDHGLHSPLRWDKYIQSFC
jgi:hypothetical protein